MIISLLPHLVEVFHINGVSRLDTVLFLRRVDPKLADVHDECKQTRPKVFDWLKTLRGLRLSPEESWVCSSNRTHTGEFLVSMLRNVSPVDWETGY